MKPSEETLTAWIDAALSPAEQAAFEADLPPNAEEERRQAKELGNLLRTHLKAAPPLRNEAFFAQSILGQITPPAPARSSDIYASWGSLFRLLWASAACLIVTFFLISTLSAPLSQGQADYFATFHNPQAGDSGISVTTFHDRDANITVLWLEGLDYLPDSQKVGARQ